MSTPKHGEVVPFRVYRLYEDEPPKPSTTFEGDPGMTSQEYKDECDINNLMARYEQTGFLTPDAFSKAQAFYGDFSDGLDFMQAQNRILAAREAFAALPARVRERFGNDPGNLLMFVQDPGNRDEAVRLGLVEAPTPQPEGVGAVAAGQPLVSAEPAGGAKA